MIKRIFFVRNYLKIATGHIFFKFLHIECILELHQKPKWKVPKAICRKRYLYLQATMQWRKLSCCWNHLQSIFNFPICLAIRAKSSQMSATQNDKSWTLSSWYNDPQHSSFFGIITLRVIVASARNSQIIFCTWKYFQLTLSNLNLDVYLFFILLNMSYSRSCLL